MKDLQLTTEEKALTASIEKGEWKSVDDLNTEKLRYASYAQAVVRKNKNISIRISETDLLKMKAKAIEEGIPYQTLIASVIHKYTTGRLSIKN